MATSKRLENLESSVEKLLEGFGVLSSTVQQFVKRQPSRSSQGRTNPSVRRHTAPRSNVTIVKPRGERGKDWRLTDFFPKVVHNKLRGDAQALVNARVDFESLPQDITYHELDADTKNYLILKMLRQHPAIKQQYHNAWPIVSLLESTTIACRKKHRKESGITAEYFNNNDHDDEELGDHGQDDEDFEKDDFDSEEDRGGGGDDDDEADEEDDEVDDKVDDEGHEGNKGDEDDEDDEEDEDTLQLKRWQEDQEEGDEVGTEKRSKGFDADDTDSISDEELQDIDEHAGRQPPQQGLKTRRKNTTGSPSPSLSLSRLPSPSPLTRQKTRGASVRRVLSPEPGTKDTSTPQSSHGTRRPRPQKSTIPFAFNRSAQPPRQFASQEEPVASGSKRGRPSGTSTQASQAKKKKTRAEQEQELRDIFSSPEPVPAKDIGNLKQNGLRLPLVLTEMLASRPSVVKEIHSGEGSQDLCFGFKEKKMIRQLLLLLVHVTSGLWCLLICSPSRPSICLLALARPLPCPALCSPNIRTSLTSFCSTSNQTSDR
ncbi:hypothetical protein DL93DRAFT_2090013 [Clavulina sp. PMI_390]|nr:hypothetical protein DL93DRAFT_2090013 [Clavulina sp. PMI_390]